MRWRSSNQTQVQYRQCRGPWSDESKEGQNLFDEVVDGLKYCRMPHEHDSSREILLIYSQRKESNEMVKLDLQEPKMGEYSQF